MVDLSRFAITRRWPPEYPDRLQFYAAPTPNGVKVSIMLEELELPYEPHFVDIGANESHDPAFLSLNPNGKIPAIIDPAGPDGQPLGLFESGAILLYLADKTGRLIPADPAARWEATAWVMWQMGGLGPMLGQLGFFHKFAGREWEDKRPRDRYAAESRRLLGVLDQRLAEREWIMGDAFTIADIACLGWVRAVPKVYQAEELLDFGAFANVGAWLERGLARPAVQRGLRIPHRPEV